MSDVKPGLEKAGDILKRLLKEHMEDPFCDELYLWQPGIEEGIKRCLIAIRAALIYDDPSEKHD